MLTCVNNSLAQQVQQSYETMSNSYESAKKDAKNSASKMGDA